MKTFRAAAAVALILTFVFTQESSAFPFLEPLEDLEKLTTRATKRSEKSKKPKLKPPKMKILTAAVTVAIMVTLMCTLKSSAVPVVEDQVLEELMSIEDPAAAPEEISVGSWKIPHNGRQKRGIFCGKCCSGGVCWRCCYA